MKGVTTVKKIIQGGLGLAFYEGRTVFLPYTAPGDKVEFSVAKEKGKVLFGRLEKILEPSNIRKPPECPNFSKCGGCHFLHLDYEDEIKIKKSMVLETLERIGKFKAVIDNIIVSPSRFGYRNNCIFRTDENGQPGFTMAETDKVIPFPKNGCLLLPKEMREAIAGLDGDSLQPNSEVRVRMDKFGAVHFWGLKNNFGPPDILMEAGGYLFPMSPDAFFQINTLLNNKLIELVLSLPRKRTDKIIDLYCGAGFFTLPLARNAMKVIGIERDEKAYENARAAAKLNKITNISFKQGMVEQKFKKTGKANLILADPPRAGMTKKVVEEIIRHKPQELILISCDPPTLARDTSRLIQGGYTPSNIHLVDLFPGTAHIETVIYFKRTE
ncbi:class I SAM-dependent RNA methyltransferase [bacterium]|nr:class I SAM-dependent RNA methyltransferase [bacterium]